MKQCNKSGLSSLFPEHLAGCIYMCKKKKKEKKKLIVIESR